MHIVKIYTIIYIDEVNKYKEGGFVENKYEINARIFKALSDANRLKILEMLSCGEMCACKLLESFDFTQPTLSHHMKVLIECGLVESRKEGTWNHYKLNLSNVNKVVLAFMEIITNTETCICRK